MLQSGLQLNQIFAGWLADIAYGAIHVLNRVISVLAEGDQLIGNTIDLRPFTRQHSTDVVEYGLNFPLVWFAGHSVQIRKQTARVAGDTFQFSTGLGDQSV